MKTVLISIKPKWSDLIISGQQKLIVMKTRPKLETPFKCYIYCTKNKGTSDLLKLHIDGKIKKMNGKVIGEFICNNITIIEKTSCGLWTGGKPNGDCLDVIKKSMLSPQEIYDYAGENVNVYGWHISELRIYNEMRELSEYRKPCLYEEDDDIACYLCNRAIYQTGMLMGCSDKLAQPPRSWCYVKEVGI